MKFQRILSKLGRFNWTLHNLVAHPVSEILFQVGLGDLGNWLHDSTVPSHVEDRGSTV